jgi:ABC-type sugar transport system ATPase subunit
MGSLTITGLSKRFGDSSAVDDASLEVADGELLALVGPSGCGKTTTLRLIAGLAVPDAGDIAVDGRSVLRAPPAARNIAMVFQTPALYPHMTVRENLTFGLRARGASRRRARETAATAAASVGVTALLGRRPATLSGGEARRVALARALAREPAVFLLDEPLTNLDIRAREHLREEIVGLQERLNATMLYVTHDQPEALAIGHRVAVMNEGRIEQVAQPRALYELPHSVFVATFLGDPPMNVLPATVADGRIRAGNASVQAPRANLPGEVLLGLRPEHVLIGGSRWAEFDPDAPRFPAVVTRAQHAGDRLIYTLDIGGPLLRARTEPGFALHIGETVQAWIDPAGVHLFDPATRRRVGANA